MVIIWGLVIMLIVNLAIGVALGELASAIPNAGGQYYWVSVLAPKRVARVSSYFVGLLSVASGIVAGAGFITGIGTIIMAMVHIYNPGL